MIAPILAGKASPVPYHQIVDDCRLVALDPTCDIRGLSDLIRSEMRKRAESMAREGRAHILSRQGMWLQRLMQLWDVFEERVVRIPPGSSKSCRILSLPFLGMWTGHIPVVLMRKPSCKWFWK